MKIYMNKKTLDTVAVTEGLFTSYGAGSAVELAKMALTNGEAAALSHTTVFVNATRKGDVYPVDVPMSELGPDYGSPLSLNARIESGDYKEVGSFDYKKAVKFLIEMGVLDAIQPF